jgi:hypothetical protein
VGRQLSDLAHAHGQNDAAIARESGQMVIEGRGEPFARPRTASA